MTKTPINLIGMRDFSEKITVTLNIIKQCYKPLLKGIAYAGLPLMLIGSILFGFSYSQMIDGMITGSNLSNPFGDSAIFMLLGYLFIVFSYIFSSGFVYQFFIEYEQDKTVDFERAFEAFKKNLGKIVSTNFKLIFAFLAPIGVIVLLAALGIFTGQVFVYIAGIFYFILIIFAIYAFMPLSYFVFLSLREGLGFLDAMRKCFALIDQRWWRSFGFYFVVGLIQMALTYIFVIPTYLLSFLGIFTGSELGENLGMTTGISVVVMLLSSMLFSIISYTMIVVLYYDLTERKHGIGLAQQIDQLGNQDSKRMENEGNY